MSRPAAGLPRRVGIVVSLVAVGLSLVTACAPAAVVPAQTPTPSASQSTPSETLESTPEAPRYHADGSATDNLPLFAEVVASVWASDASVSGAAYIDALAAAGFDKSAMQVTEDYSTVGNPAESIQFSVRWGETECLIGQVGPSTGDPATAVMPQLSGGRCLIGRTRPIDW